MDLTTKADKLTTNALGSFRQASDDLGRAAELHRKQADSHAEAASQHKRQAAMRDQAKQDAIQAACDAEAVQAKIAAIIQP